MATNPKIVPLHKPGESLRPELREFLDAVIVPALLRKFVLEVEGGESNTNKSLAPLDGNLSYSRPAVRRKT